MALFDPKADSPLPDQELLVRKDRYRQLPVEDMGSKAVLDVFNVHPKAIRSLEGGTNAMDHVVVAATVEDGEEVRKVIIRLNASTEPEEQFLVEERLYALWRKIGVRVPQIYGTHIRSTSERFDYMVMEHIGDGTLESVSSEKKRRAVYESGAHLAGLHKLSVPKTGPLVCSSSTNTLEGKYESWRVAIEDGVPDTLSYLVNEELLAPERAAQIERIFKKHAVLLDTVDSVVLHGDYHPGNILMNSASNTIAGAIDLSQAKSGDRVFDLAFFSTYEVAAMEEFVNGYKEQHALPEDLESRMNLYRLRILISKAKLRKRFGYIDRIPQALLGIEDAVKNLV